MATMKKVAPKAQKGKKVDSNTTIQKAKLDNKYNQIYAAMKKDSTDLSNKILPETYEKLRRKNSGKSPSAATLRATQDKMNKTIVKESKANKLNTKLDARGRTENAMIKNAMNSYKSGGAVKKKMKNGGSLSALNASNKRDKGTDVGGAYTTVQKKALAGAKGKASLTKDKQLGATKMAKRGMKISKKK
jgi:hypothetical protein